MSEPWDFPFPVSADQVPYDTYAAVGFFISEWESLEFNLSRMYSVFVAGNPDAATQEYHQYRFIDRLSNLEKAGETFFLRRPNQAQEGELHRICRYASGYSGPRNNIAHGILMNIRAVTYLSQKLHIGKTDDKQFLIVPPYYAKNKHPNGLPKYAYNAGQITEIAKRVITLGEQVATFRQSISGG